jgi:hypothetical protein
MNSTFQTQKGSGSRCSHAMLSRACLCYDFELAHVFGKQCLPQSVVYLVCPCVKKILSLQVEFPAPKLLGEPRRAKQGRLPTGVVSQQALQLRANLWTACEKRFFSSNKGL